MSVTKEEIKNPWLTTGALFDNILGDTKTSESGLGVQAIARTEVNKNAVPVLPNLSPEETLYFLNPLFRGVGGEAGDVEPFMKLDIVDKKQLVDFFPRFKNGAFKDLALEKSCLLYYPKKVGFEDPGLYFQTDIRLGGLLDEVLDFFRTFLADSEIVIRLSAHLGFTLEPKSGFQFQRISAQGCITGLVVTYPPGDHGLPLLTLKSAGVRVIFENLSDEKDKGKPVDGKGKPAALPQGTQSQTPPAIKPSDETPSNSSSLSELGKNKIDDPVGPVTNAATVQPAAKKETSKSNFRCEIFGQISLDLGGGVLPLNVEYTAIYSPTALHFDMTIEGKRTWREPFGVEGFELFDVLFTADVPLSKTDKGKSKMTAAAAVDQGWGITATASWKSGNRSKTKIHVDRDSKDGNKQETSDSKEVQDLNAELTKSRVVSLMLRGEMYAKTQTQKVSYLEASMEEVKFEDLVILSKELYDNDLEPPKQKLEFRTLKLRLCAGKLSLKGQIKVDDTLVAAEIWVSKEGLRISGLIENYEIADSGFVIKKASLDFIIGKKSPKGEAPEGEASEDKEVEDKDKSESTDTKGQDEKALVKKTPVTTSDIKEMAKTEAKANDSKAAIPGKEVASNTDKTATPKSPTEKEAKSSTWFIGFKVYGDIIVPFGEREPVSKGGDYKLRFKVAITSTWTSQGKWEFVFAGKGNTSVSMRTFMPDTIKEGSFLDSRLTDLTILGTNADEAYAPPEISSLKITKGKFGFYFCAVLEKVPLLEDETGNSKVLKKGSAQDRAYLKIGYKVGDKLPKIAIFFPPSFKIDFGERFYTGAIYLELDSAASPMCSFYGELFIRMQEEKEKPIKLTLVLAADPFKGSLGLKMEKEDGILNPLGLSPRMRIFKLAGSADVDWPVFLSSGALSGFGLGAKFKLDNDEYKAELRLGSNPKATIVKIEADILDIRQIVNWVAAVMGKEVETPDVDFLSFHRVNIYGSLGCTWLGEFYPLGFRLQGEAHVFGCVATMDATLDFTGFKLLTTLKGFQVGPLIIKGAKLGQDSAELEINLTWIQQSFRVTGRVEIFDSYCSIDVHVQYMPNIIFYFNFELVWTGGVIIKIYAERIQTKTKNKQHIKDADWTMSATMEQTIVAEVKAAILKAIDTAHEAVQNGIGAAQKKLDDEKAAYDKDCRDAQARYDTEYAAFQAEIVSLEEKIIAQEAKLAQVKRDNASRIEKEERDYCSKRSKAEMDRVLALEPKNSAKLDAEKKRDEVIRSEPWEKEKASRNASEKRATFFSQFGNAQRDIDDALRSVNMLQQYVSRIDDEANNMQRQWLDRPWRVDLELQSLSLRKQHGTMWLDLKAAEFLLERARDIMHSSLFRELKEAMESAERYVITLVDELASRLDTARRIVERAMRELEDAIKSGDLNFNSLMARAQEVLDKAKKDCEDQARESAERKVLLDLLKQSTVNQFKQVGSVAASQALEFARKNNIALIAAEKALDGFSAMEKAAYSTIKEFMTAALDCLVDVTSVHLEGTLTANKDQQKPFVLEVKGTLGSDKKAFVFREEWMPGKTTEFLAKLGLRAISALTGASYVDEIKALEDIQKDK